MSLSAASFFACLFPFGLLYLYENPADLPGRGGQRTKKQTEMTNIDLVKADGSRIPLNSKDPLRAVTAAVVKQELMGRDTLTLTLESCQAVDFSIGDCVEALGKTYYLNVPPRVQRSARRHLSYTVVLESQGYELTKAVMTNSFTGGAETVNETEFSYTGEFDRLMDLLTDNLNRICQEQPWSWRKVDTGADPDFAPDYGACKTLTFASENVLSALQTVCREWDVEFRIEKTAEGNPVISVGRIGRNAYEHVFRYGKDRGLYRLTRDSQQENLPPTRLYAYGSGSNLGTAYRERRRRLALPTRHDSPLVRQGLYIQDDSLVERFGLVEGAVVFDRIYPSREGTVTAVDAANELKFTDTQMFDLNEKDEHGDSKYLLGTATPTVHFNTGQLGGYEFSIAGYNSATRTFTLVPFTDENEYRYPSQHDTAFRIAPGDRYVLLGIALPPQYVQEAEERLAEKALEKYAALHRQRFSYSLEIDPFFIRKHFPNARYAPVFAAGDYINIGDDELTESPAGEQTAQPRAVKIASVSIDLYNPFRYTLELSESAPGSVLTTLVRSEKQTDKIVRLNALSDPARARRNLHTTAELLEMTFDTDGYFRDGRIRPETIETKMIAVGALSQQFLLDGVVFTPNAQGDPGRLSFSQGVLTHLGLDRQENKTWHLTPGYIDRLDEDTSYYVYARCEKQGSAGTIVLETAPIRYDEQEDFYHFAIGLLCRVQQGYRRIALTYGNSTINGREITAGRISSSSGTTYFDLDSGQIAGRIVFSEDSTTESGETILEGGKLNTRLIDTERLVARHIEASDGRIADFTLQGKEIIGRDGSIVLQNAPVATLESLLWGEEETLAIPIGSAATDAAEKATDGQSNTLTLETLTATTDVPLSQYSTHAGILRFAVDLQADTQLPEMGILTGESPLATCEVLQTDTTGEETVVDRFSLVAGRNDHLTFIDSPATYRIRARYQSTFTVDWLERPEGGTQFPILEVSARVAITGYEGADTLSYQADTPSTRIGTDGLFSFWSPRQYLYFSKTEGFRLRSGVTITSPNGEYTLTVNDQGINITGPTGTDASNHTVSFTMASTRVNIATGEKLSVAFGKIARWLADLKTVAFSGKYSDLEDRPASLPASGGNADTVDGKHASDFLPANAKGAAQGVASLDENGRVPAAQLPSYVDDVLEYPTLDAFPAQGEAGKIYVATATNLTYRWSGTGYVEISPSLALGNTSSTAFPGDRGTALETQLSSILDGSLKVGAASSADRATSADTATQLSAAPALGIAPSLDPDTPQEITITAGGKTSPAFTVPFATRADHAQNADCAASDAFGNDIRATYAQKADLPTALPASGGHADTADLLTVNGTAHGVRPFYTSDEQTVLLLSDQGKAVHVDHATSATQDGEGHDISATYLPKTGGVMTGTLALHKDTAAQLHDLASAAVPSAHQGWIVLDFGTANALFQAELHLRSYLYGHLVVSVSGYTYAAGGNWYCPFCGYSGAWGTTLPQVEFVSDEEGRRKILIGGDSYPWGSLGTVALTRAVLNGLMELPVGISFASGSIETLGLTPTTIWASSAHRPNEGIEVARARGVVPGGVTTAMLAERCITAAKLASDLTLPGTPQVGVPPSASSPQKCIATLGNLPKVYVDQIPANLKDGDIVITTTD